MEGYFLPIYLKVGNYMIFSKFGIDIINNYLLEFKNKFHLPITIKYNDWDEDIFFALSNGEEYALDDNDGICDIYDLSDLGEFLQNTFFRVIEILRDANHITKDYYNEVKEWIFEESKGIDFILTLINNFDC